MNVRVTQASLVRAALASVRRAHANVGATQEQLVTGRRINRLSDAPLDAATAQRLHTARRQLDGYGSNLEHARSEIEFAAASAQECGELFTEARDMCLRAANATADPAERAVLAEGADQLLGRLLTRANATFNGRFVFAGSATDTRPFESQVGADGRIEAVAYRGNDQRVELQVAPRTRVAINEPGSAVFTRTPTQPSTFDALIRLRDLLRNKDGLTQGELDQALSEHVEQLARVQDRATDAAARLGWRASQLEFTRTAVENAGTANAERLSNLEDADFATAAANLFSQQAALEAALTVTGRMFNNTLLEYLK